jgi:modulator of drug activity B
MEKLPTFMANDVMKNRQLEKYKTDYKKHLESVFKKI